MQRIGMTRVVVCAVLVAGLVAAASAAAAATAQWTCSASTAIATVAGKSPVNPITATRGPCANQNVGLPNATDALGLAPGITAKT
jgi:hypothetical protein